MTMHMRMAAVAAAGLILVSCGGGGSDPTAGLDREPLGSTQTAGPHRGAPAPTGSGAKHTALSGDQEADDDETQEDQLGRLRRLLADLRRDLDAALAYLNNLAGGDAPRSAELMPVVDPDTAANMPIVDLDATANRHKRMLTGVRHIGADVAPLPAGTSCDSSSDNPVPGARWCGDPAPRHLLPRAADHDGVAVTHGRIRDGVGRDKVIEWLREHAVRGESWGSGFPGLPIHSEPLTVRIAERATDRQAGWVVDAVRAINAALPSEWKLTIGEERAPDSRDERLVLPVGEVHVRFDAVGNSNYWLTTSWTEKGELSHDGGIVWIDRDIAPHGDPNLFGLTDELDYEQAAVGLLVHELLHAMGFLAHPDMASALSYSRDTSDYGGLPGHYIYPVDREGVLAAHTRLTSGTPSEDIAQELGPWSDTSIHVRGVLGLSGGGELAFGAAVRNGFAQPWAYGAVPDGDLANNPALSGSARWQGRLLGLTSDAQAIAGEAVLSVQLSTLDGTLDFSGLEAWSASAAPGAIGTGAVWGDGDLAYGVRVDGNTFVQTDGDDGTVTGGFFGAAHEGMGGTLERDDMAAGFGGAR